MGRLRRALPCLSATQCCRSRAAIRKRTASLPPLRDAAYQVPYRTSQQRRPAPVPSGAKRPPWAGRALAGGFGPRLAGRQAGAVWQRRWPLPAERGDPLADQAESGNPLLFPAPHDSTSGRSTPGAAPHGARCRHRNRAAAQRRSRWARRYPVGTQLSCTHRRRGIPFTPAGPPARPTSGNCAIAPRRGDRICGMLSGHDRDHLFPASATAHPRFPPGRG